ncbi:ATP-binding protein [Elongatibacter sediminis]|uniref:Signal transduction histidine-protein kinase/phosphatase MprB n=1 Tax=Elongatibacter sediminis TaxID=3119006 RepID=A0AAW9R9K3_9GAMM
MSRLFWKLFLTMWLSIVGFSAAIGLINDRVARGQWAEEPANTFSRGMYRIGQRLKSSLDEDGSEAARQELLAIPRMSRSFVYVVNENDHEILRRDEAIEALRRRGARMEVEEVRSAEGVGYRIYLVDRIPPTTILAPGLQGTLLRILAGALISALVSFFLARSLTSPVGALRTATRKIAEGDLDARVGGPIPRRQDELGELACDFNLMAERLQTMYQANRRLLRDVSHELRSPLARLSVALEIARGKGAEAIEPELDRIGLEGERLETLVNDVLGLLRESSEQAPKLDQVLDLGELLTELVEVVNYEVTADQSGIHWERGEPVPFRGDRELLWRALENLVRNALRHTDPARGVDLELDARPPDGGMEIRVRDYGPGVPESELERIFEPFYRVQESRDRQTGGHGIGLAIAAAAVARHGGTVRASNAADGGLRMIVNLPRPAASA